MLPAEPVFLTTKHSGCIFQCVPFLNRENYISFLGYIHGSIALQGLQTSYEMVKKFLFPSILLIWGVTVTRLRWKTKNKPPPPAYNNRHRDKVCRVTPPVYGAKWWILIYVKWKKFITNIFPRFAALAKQQEHLIIKDTEEMRYVYFKICRKEELIMSKCANQMLFVWVCIPINSGRKNKTSCC